MRMNCRTTRVTRYRFINLVGHDLSEKKNNDDNNIYFTIKVDVQSDHCRGPYTRV